MKTKSFFFIAVALFYFATNISAQQVVYEVQKIGDDTLVVRQGQSVEKLGEFSCPAELVEKYGKKAAMHAYFSRESVPVFYDQITIYPSFGLIETEVTTTTFLVREEDVLVEKIVTAKHKVMTTFWVDCFVSFIIFLMGFLWMIILSKKKKGKSDDFVALSVVGFLCVLFLCIPILYSIKFGNWLPLCMAVFSLVTGLVLGVLNNKKQRKKKTVVSHAE